MRKTLFVTSVNEKMMNGKTNPFSVKCNNGKTYILKGINEDCSKLTLFNELISYRLANLLELPIPHCELVQLPQSVIDDNFLLNQLHFGNGTCFASEYMLGATRISPIILNQITNSSDIPGIVLFDQLILNNDRSNNDGNFYYDRKNKRLIIIDHSHIFGGWQHWEVADLKRLIDIPPKIIDNLDGKNYRYLVPYINGNSPFSKVTKIISKISPKEIDGLFENIPIEWEIEREKIEVARELVHHQIKNFNLILPQLKDCFTLWKGAC
ncbi:HipA family kinase [Enterococcus sp. AZ095a]|uniref:HipA family kinase n=1 Tax=Enterococcus sp. AZ095a TaxID=2774718 RepID=UPI003D2FF499